MWISRFIRQIWQVQRAMWLHRNSFVHKGGSSVHEAELTAIDNSIRMEFILGRDGLSNEYASYFHGELEVLLSKSVVSK